MGAVTLSPGSNIQQAINNNPAGTIFNLTAGTYSDAQFLAKSNDRFIGDPNGGTVLKRRQQSSIPDLRQRRDRRRAAGPDSAELCLCPEHGRYPDRPVPDVENVTADNNSNAGVTLGANSTINGGQFDNNGQIGIDGFQADNAQVNGAEIAGNNTSGYDIDYNSGGMKLLNSPMSPSSTTQFLTTPAKGSGDIDSTNWHVENNAVWDNTGAASRRSFRMGVPLPTTRPGTMGGLTSTCQPRWRHRQRQQCHGPHHQR